MNTQTLTTRTARAAIAVLTIALTGAWLNLGVQVARAAGQQAADWRKVNTQTAERCADTGTVRQQLTCRIATARDLRAADGTHSGGLDRQARVHARYQAGQITERTLMRELGQQHTQRTTLIYQAPAGLPAEQVWERLVLSTPRRYQLTLADYGRYGLGVATSDDTSTRTWVFLAEIPAGR